MVSTIVILAVAAAALAASWSLIFQNNQPKIFTVYDWEKKKREVDVQVFRCLVDRNEERYLAFALPREQFASFQRKRTRLALRMLRLAQENADMLMGVGALARNNADQILMREAENLVAAATQLRFNLLLARYCLWVKWMFPRWAVSVPPVETRYQHVLDSLSIVRQHS
jgi:hypothetical protein